jgi:hypothetical protein
MKISGLPRREDRKERKAKASRATEMGIAGHQAAMNALGKASIKDPDTLRGHIVSETDEAGKTTEIINSNPSRY